MSVREGFARWIEAEIGSLAPAALRANLEDRGYRIFSGIDDQRGSVREAYHPERGFYKARGVDETHAYIGLLRQVWLVESFFVAPEVGPASER
ncbi:MAG: hypothetical protein AAGD14_00820 [Planctomycetota bacterium]